ncbi:MAG: class I SAM-dependent methyltransferase [Caldilineaceae bacterium]|nr:class I SAM-dependent methyltransferase [Caldilineaceae bacterium]
MAVVDGLPISEPNIPVMDYEGSQYRVDFWEGQGRDYEDAVDRVALRKLLPMAGGRIAEIGAGFGRLADLYLGYDQIILFDYSRTMLQDAVSRWGRDPRFVFVAGDLYNLPLVAGVLDTLVMVRVMHHLADVPRAFAQFQRVMHCESVAVLEFANKRNLKAILRKILGRQDWSPWAEEPVEFVELNYDFHPAWMDQQLGQAMLEPQRRLAVSHFRLPVLKQVFGPSTLVNVDRFLFEIGGFYPLSPSVFERVGAPNGCRPSSVDYGSEALERLFLCPQCKGDALRMIELDIIQCSGCDVRYRRSAGIWDFKVPVD